MFFSPFSIAITSLGEERANLSAFLTFVRFVLVWICRFPLPLGVWEGLRFVIMALPGLFSYLLFQSAARLSSCNNEVTMVVLKRNYTVLQIISTLYLIIFISIDHLLESFASRKHAYIKLIPLNPTFI